MLTDTCNLQQVLLQRPMRSVQFYVMNKIVTTCAMYVTGGFRLILLVSLIKLKLARPDVP